MSTETGIIVMLIAIILAAIALLGWSHNAGDDLYPRAGDREAMRKFIERL